MGRPRSRRTVLKDHQPIFRQNGAKTTISCACRASYEKHSRVKGGGEYYEPMEVPHGAGLLDTYNQPDQHWVDFTEKDKIRL